MNGSKLRPKLTSNSLNRRRHRGNPTKILAASPLYDQRNCCVIDAERVTNKSNRMVAGETWKDRRVPAQTSNLLFPARASSSDRPNAVGPALPMSLRTSAMAPPQARHVCHATSWSENPEFGAGKGILLDNAIK